MTSPSILRFGDAGLEVISSLVDLADPQIMQDYHKMRQALLAFQQHHQWGRSIAAPQIGIAKRLIAINAAGLPELLINPQIIWHSETQQLVWDDCMSQPEITVKVSRWSSISVKYQTIAGHTELLERLSPEHAELLQHEIDHLDGILMSQRMVRPSQIVSRELVASLKSAERLKSS